MLVSNEVCTILFHFTCTGDASAASQLSEEEVNERVQMYVDMEDPDIVVDLREHNSGHKSKYDIFWNEVDKFLQENVGLAVEERRHSQVTHIARAISVRDLLEQVAARCPPETPIPSRSWLSLQFWPKNVHAHSRLHYTGRFKVKYMVQARQFRKAHEDSHYAAAIFRYQRELAVMFRECSIFMCMDDKHRVKVGEPNYPVAAAERGRRVLVRQNETFEVGDHDFTKFSLIPSVTLSVEIPQDVTESWYSGDVFIGLKEGVFEPSSPHRHMAELQGVIESSSLLTNKSALFLYSDGGPDHRLTYLSVQLSLISLYLALYLDFLCAARTAPCHSWRNPAERVMSVINLGLQCVGLMRSEMNQEKEAVVANCNNTTQLRQIREKKPEIVSAVRDCIEPVKILLSTIFQRLKLHDKPFQSFAAATEDQMKDLWSELESIDVSLKYGTQYRKKCLDSHPSLVEFINHCCQVRHYSFTIKKCGTTACTICKSVRMPQETFNKLSYLPDPVPGEDGHYRPFTEVFGTATTEEHRPSLQAQKGRQKSLPFSASVQHVKNANLMIQCEECEMWRLVYSRYKLTGREKQTLDDALEQYTYTCGAQLSDLGLDGRLGSENVCMRSIRCYEPLEKLYYSVGTYEKVCIYCCSSEKLVLKEDFYPQCADCARKEPVKKRK